MSHFLRTLLIFPRLRERAQQRYQERWAHIHEMQKLIPEPKEPLAACPHCGCPDVQYFNGWGFGIRELDTTHPYERTPSITCSGCGCGFSVGSFSRGIDDEYAMDATVKAWNRRPEIHEVPFEISDVHAGLYIK